MITLPVDGSPSLADIETIIKYEERAFMESVGSSIGRNGSETVNWVKFEPAGLTASELKLSLSSAKAPAGHAKAWEATMLVAGKKREVTAWRAKPPAASTKSLPASHSVAGTGATTALTESAALPDVRPHAAPSVFTVVDNLVVGPASSPVKQLSSPSQSARNTRRYLVLHYTGGLTLAGTVSWFMNAAAKVSAHFVVARDGSVVQMVPLDKRAWHAGKSAWKNVNGLNGHSIGIEIVNAGKLRRTAAGWVNWANQRIPDDEVTVAIHRHETVEAGWHEYTPAQIDTVLELSMALHDALGFEDVLGHDDIAPGRKVDPGPLFPMGAIRGRLLGRA